VAQLPQRLRVVIVPVREQDHITCKVAKEYESIGLAVCEQINLNILVTHNTTLSTNEAANFNIRQRNITGLF
jgi:hypothetical protein